MGVPVLQTKGRWREASAGLWAWKHGIRLGMLEGLLFYDYHFPKIQTAASSVLLLAAWEARQIPLLCNLM